MQCLFPLQFNILDSAFSVSSYFPHLHTPSLQSGMNLPSMSWMLPWAIIVSGTLTEFPYVNLKKKTTHNPEVDSYVLFGGTF